MKSYALLALILAAPAAHAQGSLAKENYWDQPIIEVDTGAAISEPSETEKGTRPNFSVHFVSTRLAVWDHQVRTEINAGLSPIDYVRVRMEVTLGQNGLEGRMNNSAYIILPMLGDTRVRPGQNLLGPPSGENISQRNAYFGAGIRQHYNFSRDGNTSGRFNAAIKYVAISEMLAPGRYTPYGADLTGRTTVNSIEAKGLTAELGAQFSIMNKVLFGIGGEGTFARHSFKDAEGKDQIIEYQDYEGNIFAKVRVKESRRITIDVKASYWGRISNFTDSGSFRAIGFPSLGLTFGLKR